MSKPARQNNWHRFIGIGLGPFNLSLAALAHPFRGEVPQLFLEQKSDFSWHKGMLLPQTTLQVPFLADFVTMVAPTSPFSFLNYLHLQKRLYHFYFYESFHIPRTEYDHYGKWVAQQLETCRFNEAVQSVSFEAEEKQFHVTTTQNSYQTSALVLGVGSSPSIPSCMTPYIGPDVFHSAEFADKVENLKAARKIAIIGSGQSAAECVLHLLSQGADTRQLVWYTRSNAFQPMEYSKFGLSQYFSPGYRSFFYELAIQKKADILRQQNLLFKGISGTTIAAIYDALYEATVGGRTSPLLLCPVQELQDCKTLDGGYRLYFKNQWSGEASEFDSDAVILGTGYKSTDLSFLKELNLHYDVNENVQISSDFRLLWAGADKADIFVQNAELHTHGVGAPDLGLGADRAARILNSILGCDAYPVTDETIFHRFKRNEGE